MTNSSHLEFFEGRKLREIDLFFRRYINLGIAHRASLLKEYIAEIVSQNSKRVNYMFLPVLESLTVNMNVVFFLTTIMNIYVHI